MGSAGSQLRKVNPGPSSARIYRSNVPFNAQVLVQESIMEESSDEQQMLMLAQTNLFAIRDPQPYQQLQSAGDSHASEKPPVVRVPNVKGSTATVEGSLKRDVKAPHASPLR